MSIILKVWKDQPGKFFCISTKSRKGEWKDNFFRKGQRREIRAFIENNMDKDVYFCPHGFTKPRRLKKFAEPAHLLWADLDEIDPRELNDLTPSVAWESSPGRFACVWRIEEFTIEEINQALTYHIGADRGGWDMTQVLRVPGTKNFKYAAAPKVKLMWSDGPDYKINKIRKQIPQVKKTAREANRQIEIYRKYQSKFSGFVRRELLKGRPKRGQRSEVFWKLIHEVMEAGVTEEEAFELLRASPWNKFSGRRDADEQLKREIDKALSQHLRLVEEDGDEIYKMPNRQQIKKDGEEDEDEGHTFLGRSMADVEEEDIDWIWYPYIARGELTILEGDPSVGKSYLAQMMSLRICDGLPLPTEKRSRRRKVKGKIAYFDMENSSGSVTKPRLMSNGLKNQTSYYQDEQPFSIDDEDVLEEVYEAIEKHRPTLVVFDTLNTYIGKADTHKASETAQAFGHFIEIAKRFNCAVLCIRHLTKNSKEKALYRGQGSIAFTGTARIVMTVGRDPEDPEIRVVAVTKLNLAPYPRALTYTIEGLPDTLRDSDRSLFKWGDFVNLTSDDIISVAPAKSEDNANKLDQAKEFLEQILGDGPQPVAAINRAADARNITQITVKRAAKEMEIVKKISGKGTKRKSTWSLK